MQIECRTTNLLDCYAEMQLILYKDGAKPRQLSILKLPKCDLSFCKDKQKK